MTDKEKFMESFIQGLPKAELHIHLEGALEPELMFSMANRNRVKIKYRTVGEVREAYRFKNLQDFLNVYYEGTKVLLNEQDFYELAWSYLSKAASQNVLHAEVFFDPQAHTRRGVKFENVVCGIHRALMDAEKRLGVTTRLIMCFLRDLSPESAMETLEEAMPYKEWILAVGLNSAEVGNPPSKFSKVFERAVEEGFLTVAHAGEEGPAEYVWEAVSLLKVSRIDHGNNALEDESLVQELVKRKIPLTLCPISNLKLGVVKRLEDHPLKRMMDKGLIVTVNSDDPAYFGGYINENYLAVCKALSLGVKQIYKLAGNSFEASFMNAEQKRNTLKKLKEYMKTLKVASNS
jgi:adenosine deaminase